MEKNEFIIENKENDNRFTLMNTTNLFTGLLIGGHHTLPVPEP